MTDHTDGGSTEIPNHIDQIRDIILGPQRRDFEERLQKLSADLQQRNEDQASHINDVHDEMQALSARFQNDLEQGFRQLSSRLQTESISLRQEIDRVEKKTSADLEANIQLVNEAIASLRQELADTRNMLQSDLRSARDQLSRDIDSNGAELRSSKVSRESMADMLHEVAMKLRGVEVIEDLTKAANR